MWCISIIYIPYIYSVYMYIIYITYVVYTHIYIYITYLLIYICRFFLYSLYTYIQFIQFLQYVTPAPVDIHRVCIHTRHIHIVYTSIYFFTMCEILYTVHYFMLCICTHYIIQIKKYKHILYAQYNYVHSYTMCAGPIFKLHVTWYAQL